MIEGLSLTACRARQARLRGRLADLGLDAALISSRRHVHYFSGGWWRRLFSPVMLIERAGPAVLACPVPPDRDLAADEIVVYQSHRLGTLVDHQQAAAVQALGRHLSGRRRLACDRPLRIGPDTPPTDDLGQTLLSMRRTKDADEVRLLGSALEATEAAYRHAREILAPGLTEVELFAAVQAAVAAHLGEPLGEIGNDFQIGSTGSAPRRRAAQAGEIAILDISVVVRGYASDMCRSFVVGGEPSALQRAAHARVLEVLDTVERIARPGASCHDMYTLAHDRLHGYRAWTFTHHLGHGIGLCNHEAPRLNPYWDDRLLVGDVFAVEPALYGDNLRAGVRIEEVYALAADGLRKLTTFPTDLA